MKVLTITSVTKDSPGAGQFTIVGTYAETTLTSPARQVSVGEIPTSNINWSRTHQITDEAYLCKRLGAAAIGLYVTSFAKIAYTFEPTMSFKPKFTTQPDDQTAAANSDAGEFAIVVASELTATYQWQSSPDGTAWSNLSNGGEVSGATLATLTITPTSSAYNGYSFRCVATNAAGTTNSDSATMTVT